ncbi:YcaO-like family protein [Nocardia sp. NBC_00511]|uniref:YcaO-like family protein n=1 Tax=Nocardia sp. NBC_00511 TaxID=2903591 RepID=UPI0030E11AAE
MTSALLDDRTGIIRRLTPVTAPQLFPPGFHLFDSALADTRRFGPWPVDSAGGGCAFDDPDAARHAAIGEAVERYCGNLVPPGLIRGSARELGALGHRMLDLRKVALFATEQYERPGFAFHPLTADLPREWTTGTDLVNGTEQLVPADLVWVSYLHAVTARGLRHTNPIIQAGLAAGPDLDFATRAALYELLERDAMALAWHTHQPLPDLAPGPTITALTDPIGERMRPRFLLFPNEFGVPVVGALLHDQLDGYLTMGTAARPTATAAARKALAEALQLQRFVREYDDPTGPYMRAAADPRSPLLPWRAERDYADGYGPNHVKAVDYGCHLQLYLDPSMQARFLSALDSVCTTTRSMTDLDADAVPATTDAVLQRFTAHGISAIRCDLTTADIAPTGMRVVRVIAPGLYSNSAAGLPFLGGTRLAAALGGTVRRTLPLPH